MATPKIQAADLFCGVGGLTLGLQKAGIEVLIGVDNDPACSYPYNCNTKSEFVLAPVEQLDGSDISRKFGKKTIKVLAGCAPCQPFSTYTQRQKTRDSRWDLLTEFGRIVKEVRPDVVTMENVPRLTSQDVFKKFIRGLEAEKYFVSYKVVNSADYGVAQSRNRLVVLASRLGPIELMKSTRSRYKHKTVRDVIARLPPIKSGETDGKDRLHQSSELSPINLKRIRASKPGGTWRDWSKNLVAECHKRESGKTYPSVYGRMDWDLPAPTLTTQFYGFGNGRFGHPEQNRAISLREGAMLQGFPKGYKFMENNKAISRKELGRLIGNAVPVDLGKAIGKSIVRHIHESAL